MAILTALQFGRGIINASTAAAYQDIYTASATQNFMLGTKLEFADGRVFRYAKAGAVALVQAYMTQTAVKESKMVEIAQTSHAQTAGYTDITVLCTTGSAAGENEDRKSVV